MDCYLSSQTHHPKAALQSPVDRLPDSATHIQDSQDNSEEIDQNSKFRFSAPFLFSVVTNYFIFL